MNKYKILGIIGESGSGKDTLLKRVSEVCPQVHEIISYTTRPPREGELDGVNYHFISNDEFAEKVLNDEMLEASYFNKWFYGTGLESLDKDKINIGVFNPEGINNLMLHNNLDIVVFYVRASAKQRLLRQLNREENPDVDEIIRRYKTDKEDFYNLEFHHNEIENNTQEQLEYNIKVLASAVRMLQAKQD